MKQSRGHSYAGIAQSRPGIRFIDSHTGTIWGYRDISAAKHFDIVHAAMGRDSMTPKVDYMPAKSI